MIRRIKKYLIFALRTFISTQYMSQKVLLTAKEVQIILQRLACQLVENHSDFSNTVLIGIQPRGIFLLNRLQEILEQEYQLKDLKTGQLDITFYRDDFRRSDKPLEANKTKIDFVVQGVEVRTGIMRMFARNIMCTSNLS